jgi:hypothetical protein
LHNNSLGINPSHDIRRHLKSPEHVKYCPLAPINQDYAIRHSDALSRALFSPCILCPYFYSLRVTSSHPGLARWHHAHNRGLGPTGIGQRRGLEGPIRIEGAKGKRTSYFAAARVIVTLSREPRQE